MDNAEAVKATRQALRRVVDHLAQAHQRLGGQRESLGLVDVVYHPQNPALALNYVHPRRGTAWIPGPQIEQGLARLRELDRAPRLQYVEGLFPAQFGESLAKQGLARAHAAALMIAGPPAMIAAPTADSHVQTVSPRRGAAMWAYTLDNRRYSIQAGDAEPLDSRLWSADDTPPVDGVAYQRGFPVGVGRLTIHDETAHIVRLVILRDTPPDPLLGLLAGAATERGCTLIFAAASDDAAHAALVRCGFTEAGALVSYMPAESR